MREILICPDDLIEFMGHKKYDEFLKKLQKRFKTTNPIWIVAQDLGGRNE